eukprot:EC790802.1.p3 GENE.EC790802.1~~EC790802.1.p3  ORF type:complete len:78 (-),score=5.18 EC790802.1:232-465(-)
MCAGMKCDKAPARHERMGRRLCGLQERYSCHSLALAESHQRDLQVAQAVARAHSSPRALPFYHQRSTLGSQLPPACE